MKAEDPGSRAGNSGKTNILTTIVSSVLVLAFFYLASWLGRGTVIGTKVGFLYKDDSSVSYTKNFSLAARAVEKNFGERVEVIERDNVRDEDVMRPLREMVEAGCRILFTNTGSLMIQEAAKEYPGVQFCQITVKDNSGETLPSNYHTFRGESHEARYVSGIAAGMKLRELMEKGEPDQTEAEVGYVAAFPVPEVISGYVSFFLGVRSVYPKARMKVVYTNDWSNYEKEKKYARWLIEEGCRVISHHSDTYGPAIACEESPFSRRAYHVGCNQSMIDIAPTTSLTGSRINWTPYVLGAVEAVLVKKPIELHVQGNAHGTNDMSAGFSCDWVQMLELNRQIAAPGTWKKMEEAIESLKSGKLQVFSGELIGVDPSDPEDIYDLRNGYRENQNTSYPTFHYVLKDVIEIVDPEKA